MKKRTYFKTMCMVIILTGVLVISMNATAQTPKQMTPFEKKLYEAALKEGMVEWWDSLHLKEVTPFIKEFSSKYPGVKVEFAQYIATTREERYLAEYGAGRKTMDLTSLDQYQLFRDKNLLADISDIVKDVKYPTQFCARDFMGVSVEHAVLGTAYNTKLVSPKDVPKSYEDLFDPKWKGRKIAIDNEFKMFYYLNKIWGDKKTLDYVKMLGKQIPIFVKGTSATMTLLNAGEFPLATSMTLHGTIRDQEKGAPVEWAPISPSINKLSPWAVMREAPHPSAAKLFLRWFISPEGQKLIDDIRNKGNPMPGAPTRQAKTCEKMGIEIVSLAGWEVETAEGYAKLRDLYDDAIGFARK